MAARQPASAVLAGCAGDGSAGRVVTGIRGAFERDGHGHGIRVGVPVHVRLAGPECEPEPRRP